MSFLKPCAQKNLPENSITESLDLYEIGPRDRSSSVRRRLSRSNSSLHVRDACDRGSGLHLCCNELPPASGMRLPLRKPTPFCFPECERWPPASAAHGRLPNDHEPSITICRSAPRQS